MGSGGSSGYRPSPEIANLNRQTERITELEAALRAAFTAMSVARCINAVSAEYDFEPAIQQAHKALLPDKQF